MELKTIAILASLVTWTFVGHAHVQVMVPTEQAGATSTIELRFVEHASQNGPALTMGRPRQFGAIVNGKRVDLSSELTSATMGGQPAFTAKHTMKEAGAHIYFLEPEPYWEAAENVMVVHYTKLILNSCNAKLRTESEMGWENWEGWDTLVGFPVEIEPTLQCTSLWTGSAFTGIVRVDGKPAPNCRIEVEYFNEMGAVKLPNNSYLTHILRTNAQGEFVYVLVRAGWWVFTAIPQTTQKTASPGGKEVDLEMGGVLWVRAIEMDPAR